MTSLFRRSFSFSILLLALMMLADSGVTVSRVSQDAKKQPAPPNPQNIAQEVHHRLVLLPYYSVFDNLAFRVEGDTVVLEGQTVRPALKSDAESEVRSIRGVAHVINNIEVLPLSPSDEQIRRAVFHAIYGDPDLSRYAESAVPSIHIIVKDGHVTLEGVVANDADKSTAGIRANGAPNVFSVQNNLTLEK